MKRWPGVIINIINYVRIYVYTNHLFFVYMYTYFARRKNIINIIIAARHILLLANLAAYATWARYYYYLRWFQINKGMYVTRYIIIRNRVFWISSNYKTESNALVLTPLFQVISRNNFRVYLFLVLSKVPSKVPSFGTCEGTYDNPKNRTKHEIATAAPSFPGFSPNSSSQCTKEL